MAILRAQSVYVVPTKLHKHGNGLCVRINKAIKQLVPWQVGDTIAVRVAGEKLVMERIDLNSFARLRTGEPEQRPPA